MSRAMAASTSRSSFADTVFAPSSSHEIHAGRSSPSPAHSWSDAELARLNARLSDAAPEQILEWAIATLGNQRGLFQTTAFGLTGLVSTDMISKISERRARERGEKPHHLVPLIFLDTLYHFQETLALAERVERKYGADLHVFKPEGVQTAREFEERYGRELWSTDEASYDYLVKVEPARRAYDVLGVQAVLTGRRRSQGGARSAIPVIERDETGLLKINPLANWTFAETKAYADVNAVPYNALLDQGYTSVGDWHSTRAADGSLKGASAAELDAAERSGRWADKAGKTECGLHKDYFKMQAAFKKAQREKEAAARDAARDAEELQASSSSIAIDEPTALQA